MNLLENCLKVMKIHDNPTYQESYHAILRSIKEIMNLGTCNIDKHSDIEEMLLENKYFLNVLVSICMQTSKFGIDEEIAKDYNMEHKS